MAQNRDKIIVLVVVLAAVFLLFVVAIGYLAISRTRSDFAFGGIGDKVAIVDVKGVIEGSDDIVRQIRKYKEDNTVKALVLRIDSPGGGVAASQEIYQQVKEFREKDKFVVASMGSVAASGGYYVACAADSIFANPGTLTGSIGVILSFPIFQNLMNKVGIDMAVIKSGKLKDVGNFARPMTPEDEKMLQSVIDDTYAQFVAVVSEGRKLDSSYVRQLADGSIFTGQQAVGNGLIDRLGTLDDAIAVAGEVSDLGRKPNIIKERPGRRLWWEMLAESLGFEAVKSNFTRPWPALEYRFEL